MLQAPYIRSPTVQERIKWSKVFLAIVGDGNYEMANNRLERFQRFQLERNIKEGDGMFQIIAVLFNCGFYYLLFYFYSND